MRWGDARRLAGPFSGLLHVVLVFVGGAVVAGTRGAGRHSLDATTDEVAAYVADADAARVWVGEYVGLLGFLLFLPFAAHLAGVLRDRGRGELEGRVAAMAATAYVALSAAGIAALVPALNRDDAEAAASLLDLRTALLGLAFVFLAVWLLAVGLRMLATRAFPRWLGWAAVTVGLLQLAATPLAAIDVGFTGIPTFASFLWILVAAVVLLRRPPPPDAAAP